MSYKEIMFSDIDFDAVDQFTSVAFSWESGTGYVVYVTYKNERCKAEVPHALSTAIAQYISFEGYTKQRDVIDM